MAERAHVADGPSRTRDEIARLLKQFGPSDSQTLAERLGVSPMAVRQHLYALRDRGLVTSEDEPRPKGRPAKVWRITPQADGLFPEGYAGLASSMIESARQVFGPDGLDRLLAATAAREIAAYRRRLPRRGSLRRRVEALAAIRTAEGFMAEVQPGAGRSLLLIENHCPIRTAARACPGICRAEIAVFRAVLGPGVSVERVEHIVEGARRCAYLIAIR